MSTLVCCLRTAGSLQRLTTADLRPASRALYHSTQKSTIATHSSSPLVLDFLAPAWISHEPLSSRPSSRLHAVKRIQSAPRRRNFSSSTRRDARIVANARTDDEGKEMIIKITPRAAHRLQAIAEKDKNPEIALRVSVESGGCHGFQYLMKLINMPEVDKEEDTIFEDDSSSGGGGGGGGDSSKDGFRARVVMDEPSLELLKGSSIDYTMELIGSQFKVTGIPGAKSSCGCGTSFDIAE